MRLTKELSINSVFDAALCNTNKTGWTLRRRKWSHVFLFTTLDDPFCASSGEKPVEFCRAHSTPRVPEHQGLAAAQAGGQGRVTLRDHGDTACAAACTATCPPCWQVREGSWLGMFIQSGETRALQALPPSAWLRPNLVLYVSWNPLLWGLLQKHNFKVSPVRYVNIKLHARTKEWWVWWSLNKSSHWLDDIWGPFQPKWFYDLKVLGFYFFIYITLFQ